MSEHTFSSDLDQQFGPIVGGATDEYSDSYSGDYQVSAMVGGEYSDSVSDHASPVSGDFQLTGMIGGDGSEWSTLLTETANDPPSDSNYRFEVSDSEAYYELPMVGGDGNDPNVSAAAAEPTASVAAPASTAAPVVVPQPVTPDTLSEKLVRGSQMMVVATDPVIEMIDQYEEKSKVFRRFQHQFDNDKKAAIMKVLDSAPSHKILGVGKGSSNECHLIISREEMDKINGALTAAYAKVIEGGIAEYRKVIDDYDAARRVHTDYAAQIDTQLETLATMKGVHADKPQSKKVVSELEDVEKELRKVKEKALSDDKLTIGGEVTDARTKAQTHLTTEIGSFYQTTHDVSASIMGRAKPRKMMMESSKFYRAQTALTEVKVDLKKQELIFKDPSYKGRRNIAFKHICVTGKSTAEATGQTPVYSDLQLGGDYRLSSDEVFSATSDLLLAGGSAGATAAADSASEYFALNDSAYQLPFTESAPIPLGKKMALKGGKTAQRSTPASERQLRRIPRN